MYPLSFNTSQIYLRVETTGAYKWRTFHGIFRDFQGFPKLQGVKIATIRKENAAEIRTNFSYVLNSNIVNIYIYYFLDIDTICNYESTIFIITIRINDIINNNILIIIIITLLLIIIIMIITIKYSIHNNK